MSFNSTSAETAQFTEARRGFEPEEVHKFQADAVGALRAYEKEIAALRTELEDQKQRLSDLEIAEEAVKRTFVAAGETKQQMIAEAEAEAAKIRQENEKTATELLSSAQRDSEAMRSAAEDESSRLRVGAKAESEKLLTDAKAEAERLVAEASREAAEQAAEARSQKRALDKRLNQLRTALTELEEKLNVFANGALDEVSVAKDLIDLETKNLSEMEGFSDVPVAATATAPSESAPTVKEQVAARAEARREAASADAAIDEALDETDEKESFYSRRMGGLKQRIAENE